MLALTLNRTRRTAWSIAVVAGLGACSAEPAPRIGPAEPELRALVDEHCQSVAICACAGEVVEDGCAGDLSARWEARRDTAETLGLQYDAECFENLFTQVQDYDCYWPGGANPLCDSFCAVFYGDKALGEGCEAHDSQSSDCAPGLLCDQGSCVEPCTVLSGRLLGESCAELEFGQIFDDCAQGLFCSWETGTCAPLGQQGQTCDFTACAEGLACSWQSNTCEPVAAEGENCEDRPCVDDHYCNWNGEGQAQTCRAYAAEGEPCDGQPCADDLWCSDNNLCISAPGEGQACLFGSICAEGTVCSDVEFGTCLAAPEAGAPCLQTTCAASAWCDTSEVPEGICAVAQPIGETCAGHRQCESNYCPNGFCWAPPLAGEPCDEANICAAGLVCNGQTCEATTARAPAVCSYPGW